MNKVNTLTLCITLAYALTGCSTQQVSGQTQVVQNAPPQMVMASVPSSGIILPNNTKAAVRSQPVTVKPRVSSVVATPSASVKSRVTPAPKVKTVKKPVPTIPSKQTPWQRRQQSMSRMQSWSMGGRAALRFKGEAWTFGLNWVQRNKQQYSLQIRNPITGTVVGVLDQSPGRATLKSRGRVSTGPDAERLLQQQLRVKMPVNGMPYWIRGVMAPQYPVGKVVLDAKGRPRQIVQAGWVMDYFNYKGLDANALPGKVNISRAQEQVNVRILAKKWQRR